MDIHSDFYNLICGAGATPILEMWKLRLRETKLVSVTKARLEP